MSGEVGLGMGFFPPGSYQLVIPYWTKIRTSFCPLLILFVSPGG